MNDTEPLSIERVNALPRAELETVLGRCVAVPRWVRELADARPFASGTALVDRARALAEGLGDGEVLAALADHPRIGERTDGRSLSAAEQSGVDDRDAELAARLATGNAAYEARFGHIYLVCASGRGGWDLLADLETRLANGPAAEIAVARGELAGVAAVRVAGLVAGLVAQ